jgi:hypothetical protein
MEGAGAPAGWAYVSNGHGVAVSVDYGIPAGSYAVRIEPESGSPETIGTVQVDSGRGSWTGRSEQALGGGSRITLVDASGTEVCHGTVPHAE